MFNKERIKDLMDQIEICRNDLSNFFSDYTQLYTMYHSNSVYGANQFDKNFVEVFEKGMKSIHEFEGFFQDNLSKLASEASNSADSWFEIIPKALQ